MGVGLYQVSYTTMHGPVCAGIVTVPGLLDGTQVIMDAAPILKWALGMPMDHFRPKLHWTYPDASIVKVA